jgi:hypothetical protein
LPVEGGVLQPTGAATERLFVGRERVPPEYVPVSTGAPKKSWALRTSKPSPGDRMPETSTLTLLTMSQL